MTLASRVDAVLHGCGVPAQSVRAAAVYGSRVAGGASPASDVDLFVLCETARRRHRVGEWDVLLVPWAQASDFRHEEVASHIHKFGLWVQGDAGCIGPPTFRWAMNMKEGRIRRLLRALDTAGPSLNPARLERHFVELALQFERWATLRAERPLPSTPNVRRAWNSRSQAERALLLRAFGSVARWVSSSVVAAAT